MRVFTAFLFCFLLWAPYQSQAQKNKKRRADIIYYQDGSKIIGFTEEKSENGDLVFKTLDGQVINILATDIKKKEKSEEKDLYFEDGTASTPTKGFSSIIRISSSWGKTDDEDVGFSGMHFHIINGHHFSQYLFVGVASGIDILSGPASNTYTFTPLYLNVRGYLTESRVTPFYSIGGGIGIAADIFDNFFQEDEFYKSGLLLRGSVGLAFATRKRNQFYFDVGYFRQASISQYNTFIDGEIPVIVNENIVFNRLEVGFGWIF